jgi:C6 transcription factor Pro1
MWYANKADRKEVMNSDEAKNIRTLAETCYKIRRKVGSKDVNTSVDKISGPEAEEDDKSGDIVQFHPGSVFSGANTSLSTVFAIPVANIWQLHPESIWWDSKMKSLTLDPSSSSQGETRLLMLFLDVIHPITHTFYKLENSTDRSWMLNRLVGRKALYCSALSISACFDHSLTQPPTINEIGICSRVRQLQNRAVQQLQIDIDKFVSMQPTPLDNFILNGLDLLDVIVHLETLEIFSMLQGYWELHHQAARKILNHIEACALPCSQDSSQSKTSILESALTDWPSDHDRRRMIEFSIANFIWVDVLAISTFGALSYSPCCFEYLGLLQSEVIKPQDIMGCQGRIMAKVVQIARLEQWKVKHQHRMHVLATKAELLRRDEQLATELAHEIRRLENECQSSKITSLDEDKRLISIIWAYGAQILRQVIISDIETFQPVIDQTFVDICLQKLEALPTRLVMRITWPYTIAGCMSSSDCQHERFRRIVGRTMQEAQPPGISWKGLIVMEECWRLRLREGNLNVSWREAMTSLGARVLLA